MIGVTKAAIDAIRSHLQRGDLSDGLVFDAVRIRLLEIGEAVKALPYELLDPGDPRLSVEHGNGQRGLRQPHRYQRIQGDRVSILDCGHAWPRVGLRYARTADNGFRRAHASSFLRYFRVAIDRRNPVIAHPEPVRRAGAAVVAITSSAVRGWLHVRPFLLDRPLAWNWEASVSPESS